jgi:hypothetical protein
MLLAILYSLISSAAALVGVALCSNGSDATQQFIYEPSTMHIQMLSDKSKCLQVATGCCNGELMRGGSYLEVQACAAGFESQKLSWPSAANNFTLRPLSTAGEPQVSLLADGAQLVFDARGYFFPGVQLIGAPYHPLVSAFTPDASGRLINAATGLCVTSEVVVAAMAQQLNLQPCAPNKQLPGNGPPSTQLFSFTSGQLRTSEDLCATAERPMGVDVRGGARLIAATCAGAADAPLFASQALNLSAGGHLTAGALPGAPTADAGAGAWWGARVPLSAAPPSKTGAFAFRPVNGTPSLGVLTHLETGLCLDSAGVPEGQGCLDVGVRGLPFCDPALPLEARLDDLLARLTLSEATGFTGDDGENDSPCGTHTAAVPRLDITQLRWLVEVSSMASSVDSCTDLSAKWHAGCPTSFPAAMLQSGAFNATLWRAHGRVVGDEMRALNNLMTTSTPLSPGRVSLAGHGPDIVRFAHMCMHAPPPPRRPQNTPRITHRPHPRRTTRGTRATGASVSCPAKTRSCRAPLPRRTCGACSLGRVSGPP